jgi:hypothetical protein
VLAPHPAAAHATANDYKDFYMIIKVVLRNAGGNAFFRD